MSKENTSSVVINSDDPNATDLLIGRHIWDGEPMHPYLKAWGVWRRLQLRENPLKVGDRICLLEGAAVNIKEGVTGRVTGIDKHGNIMVLFDEDHFIPNRAQCESRGVDYRNTVKTTGVQLSHPERTFLVPSVITDGKLRDYVSKRIANIERGENES